MEETDMINWYYTGTALMAIIVWSCIYKNNVVFRVTLSSIIGCSMGYYFAASIQTTVWTGAIIPILNGNYTWIIPLILGFMLFIRLIWNSHRAISMYPTFVLLGATMGATWAGSIISQLYSPILATISISTTNVTALFNSILMIVTVLTSMIYFTVTIERKGPLGTVAKIGRYLQMIGLGIIMGSFIMSRIGMIAGKINYLTANWLGV
jgi:hypothetical protein